MSEELQARLDKEQAKNVQLLDQLKNRPKDKSKAKLDKEVEKNAELTREISVLNNAVTALSEAINTLGVDLAQAHKLELTLRRNAISGLIVIQQLFENQDLLAE